MPAEAATSDSGPETAAPPKRRKVESAAGVARFSNPSASRGGGGGGRWSGGGGGGGGGNFGKSIQSRNENFVRLNMKLKKYRKKGEYMYSASANDVL